MYLFFNCILHVNKYIFSYTFTRNVFQMGFGALFRSNSTFDNFLCSGTHISLDNIDHHVVVIVNGTVTPLENREYPCPDKSERVIDFEVSRPFLFYVIDLETRVPYFSGLQTNFEGKGKIDNLSEFKKYKMVENAPNCMKIERNL